MPCRNPTRSTLPHRPNAAFIAELYARYLEDPDSVDASWRGFFAELRRRARGGRCKELDGPGWGRERGRIVIGHCRGSRRRGAERPCRAAARGRAAARRSIRIRAMALIRAYRVRGHLIADLDPLGLAERDLASRSRSRDLRLHRGRLRPADLRQRPAGLRDRDAARDPRGAAGDLLRPGRHRIHAHPGARAAPLDPGAHRGAAQPDRIHRPRASAPSSSGSPRPSCSSASSTSATPAPSASASKAARR